MWLSRKPTKDKLRQYKTIKVNGMRFVIKKLNPLVDFTSENMPQIFTSFISRRKIDDEKKISEAILRRTQEDMKNMINAGLVPEKIDQDIDIEDILSDSDLALKLYTEILAHSLNMFRGLKGVFFSAKLKQLFYMNYRKHMEKLPTK